MQLATFSWEGLAAKLVAVLIVALVGVVVAWLNAKMEQAEIERRGKLPESEKGISPDVLDRINRIARIIIGHRGSLPPLISPEKLDDLGERELVTHYDIPLRVTVRRQYAQLKPPVSLVV